MIAGTVIGTRGTPENVGRRLASFLANGWRYDVAAVYGGVRIRKGLVLAQYMVLQALVSHHTRLSNLGTADRRLNAVDSISA